MFILQPEPRWTWPVTVRTPTDGGGYAEHTMRATFRHVSEERRRELGREGERGTIQILREAVVELLDIANVAGEPLRHSPELLEAVLANPWIRTGLLFAYGNAIAGQPLSEVSRGN